MLIFVTEQSASALVKFLAFGGRIVHSFLCYVKSCQPRKQNNNCLNVYGEIFLYSSSCNIIDKPGLWITRLFLPHTIPPTGYKYTNQVHAFWQAWTSDGYIN